MKLGLPLRGGRRPMPEGPIVPRIAFAPFFPGTEFATGAGLGDLDPGVGAPPSAAPIFKD